MQLNKTCEQIKTNNLCKQMGKKNNSYQICFGICHRNGINRKTHLDKQKLVQQYFILQLLNIVLMTNPHSFLLY